MAERTHLHCPIELIADGAGIANGESGEQFSTPARKRTSGVEKARAQLVGPIDGRWGLANASRGALRKHQERDIVAWLGRGDCAGHLHCRTDADVDPRGEDQCRNPGRLTVNDRENYRDRALPRPPGRCCQRVDKTSALGGFDQHRR